MIPFIYGLIALFVALISYGIFFIQNDGFRGYYQEGDKIPCMMLSGLIGALWAVSLPVILIVVLLWFMFSQYDRFLNHLLKRLKEFK